MSEIVKNPPKPGTEAWWPIVTASKVPVILGLSPFDTAHSLWYQMKGLIPPEEPDERREEMYQYGHAMEDGLVNWWRSHNPDWQTNSAEIAYTDEDLPFPNLATLDRRAYNRRGKKGERFKIIECKTTGKRGNWLDDEGNIAAPPYVIAQTFAQMGFSGIHSADVVALIPGARTAEETIFSVQWDEEIWQDYCHIIDHFYRSLDGDEPPELADLEPKTNPHVARPEGEFVLDDAEIIADYVDICLRLKGVEAEKARCEARLADIAREHGASKVKALGYSLAKLRPAAPDRKKIEAQPEYKHLLTLPQYVTSVTQKRINWAALRADYPELVKHATGEDHYSFTPAHLIKKFQEEQ